MKWCVKPRSDPGLFSMDSPLFMKTNLRKNYSLSSLAVLSLMAHALGLYTLAQTGSYDFTRPVTVASPFIV
jgi:hypothetical protein